MAHNASRIRDGAHDGEQPRDGIWPAPSQSTMTAAVSNAVDLLSMTDAQIASITASATAALVETEQKKVDSLSDEELFAEAAKLEQELKKALAAAAKKGSPQAAAQATQGPVAVFEGVPIDCGAVADAALKVDVEGSEVDVAKGMAELLASQHLADRLLHLLRHREVAARHRIAADPARQRHEAEEAAGAGDEPCSRAPLPAGAARRACAAARRAAACCTTRPLPAAAARRGAAW